MPSNPNTKNTGANTGADDDQLLSQEIDQAFDKITAPDELKFTSLAQEDEKQPESGEQVAFRSTLRSTVGDDDITQIRRKPQAEDVVELSADDLEEIVDEDENVLFLSDEDVEQVSEEDNKKYHAQLIEDLKRIDAQKTAPQLASAKGIDVVFPRSDGSTTRGKMIEWDLSEFVLVVGPDKKPGEFARKRINIEKLYALNPGLKEKVDHYDLALEERDKLTSLLEDMKNRTITKKEIGRGVGAETLSEGLRTFELPGGIEGAAATSAAGYNHIEKKRGRNEDRYFVNPQTGFVAVIDGMGGGKSGPRAADIVAKNLASNETDIAGALLYAQAMMKADPEIGKADGACLVTAKLEIGKPIDINQCGDVDIYHFGPSGDAKYRPGQHLEQNKPAQSAFEALKQMSNLKVPEEQVRKMVTSMSKSAKKDFNKADEEGLNKIIDGIVNNKEVIVERDNPLYGSLRKMVVNALTSKQLATMNFQSPGPLEGGDWVLVLSDGVSDNFEDGEIEGIIKTASSEGRTSEWVTSEISRLADERMKMQAEKNPAAAGKHYKLDNATILTMRAKPTAEPAVAQPAVA